MIDVTGPLLLEPGDKLLLCSDGLWGTVLDSEITAQLAARPIADAVPELVEQALRNGGARCDNVTVLAVEWEGSGAPIPAPAKSWTKTASLPRSRPASARSTPRRDE